MLSWHTHTHTQWKGEKKKKSFIFAKPKNHLFFFIMFNGKTYAVHSSIDMNIDRLSFSTALRNNNITIINKIINFYFLCILIFGQFSVKYTVFTMLECWHEFCSFFFSVNWWWWWTLIRFDWFRFENQFHLTRQYQWIEVSWIKVVLIGIALNYVFFFFAWMYCDVALLLYKKKDKRRFFIIFFFHSSRKK